MRSLKGILFGSGGGFWLLVGVEVEVGVDDVGDDVVKDRRKVCIVRFCRQLVQMFLVFMVNWRLCKSGIEDDGAFFVAIRKLSRNSRIGRFPEGPNWGSSASLRLSIS